MRTTLLTLSVLISWEASSLHAGWTIRQLTDNDVPDVFPDASGGKVVWQMDGDSSSEIMLFDGSQIIQLTENDLPDKRPRISGDNVVWRHQKDYDVEEDDLDWAREIMFYDGNSITRLTDNDLPDHRPYVSGSNVVWWQQDGNDGEIMLYDGNSITQLTDNNYRDYRPRVSGANVAWLGRPNDVNQVFLFDGSTTTQLTYGDFESGSVRVNGNSVVWQSWDLESGKYDVYLYDRTTIVNLTPGDARGWSPDIWGSRVAWYGQDADGADGIFLYDGQSTVRLTDEDSDWFWSMPDVSDQYVVWRGVSDDDPYEYGIFVFDGDSTIQLTETEARIKDLDVSGTTIVWSQYDLKKSEIFMATIPELPEPVLGDFDGDTLLTAVDIDLLSAEVRAGTHDPQFDLTDDGSVDGDDRIQWVEVLADTYFGDANLDGEFNSEDFVAVFDVGEYEDAIADNSTWADGDWDGDQEFGTEDFVMAFQRGGYEQGPRAGVQAIPEPSSWLLGSLGLFTFCAWGRSKRRQGRSRCLSTN